MTGVEKWSYNSPQVPPPTHQRPATSGSELGKGSLYIMLGGVTVRMGFYLFIYLQCLNFYKCVHFGISKNLHLWSL